MHCIRAEFSTEITIRKVSKNINTFLFIPYLRKLIEYNKGENDKILQLQINTEELKSIIVEDLDKVLERGEKIEDIRLKSED